MILKQENSLMLIIDIQEKLLNAIFNKDIVNKKSEILVKAFNLLEIPTIVTEQYPKGLGETAATLKSNLNNQTCYFEKNMFNALAEEDIFNKIKSFNKKQIIIIGIETHICVYQTVMALIEQGYDVIVIKDSCGSRSELEHNDALECMKDLGAKVKTTEMLLFELLKSSKHPCFKAIQSLIK